METLETSSSEDPPVLDDPVRGLGHISDSVKSNIGKKRRTFVSTAWRNFFVHGISDPDYPLGWELANMTTKNANSSVMKSA